MSTAPLYLRRQSRIGMTALIDVVFILLMFFMLTSSFNHWKAVEFRSPVAAEDRSAKEAQLVVLGAGGTLRLVASGAEIAPGTRVDAGLFNAGQSVVILPEAKVSVQSVIASLERLEALGLSVTLGNVIAVEVDR